MITNPDWLYSKDEPDLHQISMQCIDTLTDCQEKYNKGEIDADTSFRIFKQTLTEEINNPEFLVFAIENYSELSSYIASGRISIRIHRNKEGKMWFGVG